MFQMPLQEGAPFDEARIAIHAVLEMSEYCADAVDGLSCLCEARFWQQWRLLLGDFRVHGPDGRIVCQVAAQEAVKLTMADVKNRILQTEHIRTQWQRLCANNRELHDDELVQSLRSASLIVSLGPFQDVVGTWHLLRPRPLEKYEKHLHEITLHARGCTDSEGRTWDLELSQDRSHLLLDGRVLQFKHRLLSYTPSSGVCHHFRRAGEKL